MKEIINNFKRAFALIKNQKKRMLLYIICNLFYILINIVVPLLSAKQIVKITNSEFLQIIYISIIIFGMECVHNIIFYIKNNIYYKMNKEGMLNIQNKLLNEVLKINTSSLDKINAGVIIERISTDTSNLINIFDMLNFRVSSLIMNIGIFVAIFMMNKWICFYMLFVMIIDFILDNKHTNKMLEYEKNNRTKKESTMSFVMEVIRGLTDIKMLNAENQLSNKLKTEIEDYSNKRYNQRLKDMKFNFLRIGLKDLSDFIRLLLLVVLMYYEKITPLNVIVIFNYLHNMSSLLNTVESILKEVKEFNLSADRVFELIDSHKFEKEKFGKKHPSKIEGNIEFKDVTFGYNEKKVLKNINFSIHPNETVAIVGKSGCGKSTIFKLICKLYDVDSGKILIDDIDISNLDKESIRGNINIISQNPYIFNLSIRDNIKLVKDNITDKELKEICRIACLEEFIENLPDKYDTVVGENGIMLSGGEKQRLAIARGLAQNKKIMLFDEATSALDNETQSNIQQAIENMKDKYTIIIIAHRLSTIINSDRILYVEDGKIKDTGTHSELLKKCEPYKRLYTKEILKKN